MRLIRDPLISQDLDALVDHIVEATQGDFAAAEADLETDAVIGGLDPPAIQSKRRILVSQGHIALNSPTRHPPPALATA